MHRHRERWCLQRLGAGSSRTPRLPVGVEWEGRKLVGDARPSHDLELQSDAAFPCSRQSLLGTGFPLSCAWRAGIGPKESRAGKGSGARAPRPGRQRSAYSHSRCRGSAQRVATSFSTPGILGNISSGPLAWECLGGREGSRATQSDCKSPGVPTGKW